VLGEKPIPMPFGQPEILHGLSWNKTRPSTMRSLRLSPKPWHGLCYMHKTANAVYLNIQCLSGKIVCNLYFDVQVTVNRNKFLQ